MTPDAVQRDLGRMEAQLSTLTATVAHQSIELAKINNTLAAAQGGWKALMMVGGFSAVLGGILSQVAAAFIGRH